MQKFFDIILLKFIDDNSYRAVMTAIVLFAIIFTINVDRKQSAETAALKTQLLSLDDIRLQMLSNESKNQYDVLIETYALFLQQNNQFRIMLIEHLELSAYDKKMLIQKVDAIDNIINKQLMLLNQLKISAQEYYNMLRVNHGNVISLQGDMSKLITGGQNNTSN